MIRGARATAVPVAVLALACGEEDEGVPAGEHEIAFVLIGYDAGSATITVSDDTIHVPARLRPTRIQLDDLIIQPSTEPADTLAAEPDDTSTTGSPDTSGDDRPR